MASNGLAEASPDLHCWLRNVPHRGFRSRWFSVELPRAGGASLDVTSKGCVHALVLWQHHGNPKAGPSVLQEFHLITVAGFDPLAVFEPGDLKRQKTPLKTLLVPLEIVVSNQANGVAVFTLGSGTPATLQWKVTPMPSLIL